MSGKKCAKTVGKERTWLIKIQSINSIALVYVHTQTNNSATDSKKETRKNEKLKSKETKEKENKNEKKKKSGMKTVEKSER